MYRVALDVQCAQAKWPTIIIMIAAALHSKGVAYAKLLQMADL